MSKEWESYDMRENFAWKPDDQLLDNEEDRGLRTKFDFIGNQLHSSYNYRDSYYTFSENWVLKKADKTHQDGPTAKKKKQEILDKKVHIYTGI